MKQSFYLFALRYRGGQKNDKKSQFAENMFLQHDFPKTEASFQVLSQYIEELAHPEISAVVFDELWELFVEENK